MNTITFEQIRDAIYYAKERNRNDLTIYIRQSDIDWLTGVSYQRFLFGSIEMRPDEKIIRAPQILGCEIALISEKADHDWSFIVGSQSTLWTLCVSPDGAFVEKPWGLEG